MCFLFLYFFCVCVFEFPMVPSNEVEHDMPRTPQRALAGASGGQRRRVDLDEASGSSSTGGMWDAA